MEQDDDVFGSVRTCGAGVADPIAATRDLEAATVPREAGSQPDRAHLTPRADRPSVGRTPVFDVARFGVWRRRPGLWLPNFRRSRGGTDDAIDQAFTRTAHRRRA